MVIYEHYGIDSDGIDIRRVYSDEGKHIEKDGEIFEQVFEPETSENEYTETDEEEVNDIDGIVEELRNRW